MTDEHAMKVAKVIANAMGDNFSDAFKNKQRWTAKRGMSGGRFRDVNEPFQDDYIAAAKAAAAVIAADRAGLVARIAELESEVAEKRHAIDRDRYIVAAVLGEIRKQINGHRWLLEGRGPYEWDDDRYHLEFGDWLDNVESASENLAKLAWDKSNSETDPERVEAARKAAGSFLIETRPGTRVMLSSDLGLPCPTCKQIPRAALKDTRHDD